MFIKHHLLNSAQVNKGTGKIIKYFKLRDKTYKSEGFQRMHNVGKIYKILYKKQDKSIIQICLKKKTRKGGNRKTQVNYKFFKSKHI